MRDNLFFAFIKYYTPEYAEKPQSIGKTTPVIAEAQPLSQMNKAAPNNSSDSTNLLVKQSIILVGRHISPRKPNNQKSRCKKASAFCLLGKFFVV